MLFIVGISRRRTWIADGPVIIVTGAGKITNLCGTATSARSWRKRLPPATDAQCPCDRIFFRWNQSRREKSDRIPVEKQNVLDRENATTHRYPHPIDTSSDGV